MADILRLTYSELGKRLGLTPDGGRFRARRRMWSIENGNSGKKLVVLTEAELAAEAERMANNPGMIGRASADDRASAQRDSVVLDFLRDRLERVEGEAVQLRQQVADLRVELGTARAETAARDQRLADLQKEFDRELARGARLEDELRYLRRPWWRRLLS
jgi:chromosome segregation ATPase